MQFNTLDMLRWWTNLDIAVASRSEESGALSGNGVPGPFEHLDDDGYALNQRIDLRDMENPLTLCCSRGTTRWTRRRDASKRQEP